MQTSSVASAGVKEKKDKQKHSTGTPSFQKSKSMAPVVTDPDALSEIKQGVEVRVGHYMISSKSVNQKSQNTKYDLPFCGGHCICLHSFVKLVFICF